MHKLLIILFSVLVIAFGWSYRTAGADTRYGFVEPALLEVISVEFAADQYSRANYDPFVKMKVFNNSPETITQAYIKVTVSADKGRFRLFTDRFRHIANGGLRPYTSDVWKFYPRGSSQMALKGLPRDATITAEVEQVFCPKKNSPWHYEHKFDYPQRHDFAW